MALDDLVLALQGFIDRFIRWLRIGAAPARGRRRLVIVQIDGLSGGVLEQALREGRMPFLARLLRRTHRLAPMSVGMPTSTPAFQMAAMYGVRPDIPGFHFHDKRRHADIYFPRSADAALSEMRKAAPSLVILDLNNARTNPLGIVASMKEDPALASVPTIGYASHVQIDVINAARQAGVGEVMPRSVFTQQLAEILGGSHR